MKRVLLGFQLWILIGQILTIRTPQIDGTSNAEAASPTSHGQQLATTPPPYRSSVSATNRKQPETQIQDATLNSLTPVAASIANAERVVNQIPDKNMDITVIKPNDVEKERFTMADVMKEELADSTNFPNIIDDYDLGPNASF